MNKQELIQEFKKVGIYRLDIFGTDIEGIPTKSAICLIEQLDEPQKVVIPQFVAEYIEKSRLKGWDLLASMCFVLNEKNKKTTKWLYLGENKNIFALAWIYGYEVEEKKRYKVVMPNVSSSGGVLTRIKHDDSWIWIDTLGTIVEGRTHTRKELEEAGFGWVFDCEGVEVEEVE